MAHVNVEVVAGEDSGKVESLKVPKGGPLRIYTDEMVFSHPNISLANHLKPIYVSAHLEGVPFKRILIDGGAAVNVLPAKQMKRMGRSTEDLIPTDLTERRQEKKLLDKEEQEWQEKVSTSQHGNEEESCTEELDRAIQMAECMYDIDEPDGLPENPELVEFLCAEPDKPPPEVQDPLEVIDLGTEEDPRPIQISGLLRIEDRAKIIFLLQEFKDCFAWHYTEMPGNINSATPKDEYPMPMADLSIDVQRAMNAIFHDLIGQSMEVYIDDIVVKSKTEEQHIVDLKQALMRMRIHKLKMNPKKCAFGVRAGNFLGFLVHQRGVEVDKNKSRAILESLPPTNKVQLQRLLGKINFLRRFIANLAGKIQPLTPLLRLKDKENFEWGPTHQQAFDNIKAYLTSPPVLMPPQRGKPLKLYISASERSIGSLLAQNNEGGKEQAVYYLSRILTEVETRYSPVERLCLALYFTATGRIGKWILALSEFSFQYVPQMAVKGQAIADFLAEHQEPQSEEINIPGSLEKAAGAGIVIINPQGVYHYYSFLLDYQENTNNRAEYEALIIGLEILMDLEATEVEIFGDSELVINQLNGDGSNLAANEMAQLASGIQMQERKYGVDVEIQTRNLPSILDRGFSLDVMVLETEVEDWRTPIMPHLKDPSSPTSKKNRQQATKYVLWTKNLLRKTPDGLLLKCLGQEESMRVMAEVHEGICGAHQAGTKMRWLLRRYGYFWPDMVKDCKSYARGCEECQRHGPLQHVPSVPLNPVVKPWPF
ncbi:unnamed protein product [Malus baccata var. baccata]